MPSKVEVYKRLIEEETKSPTGKTHDDIYREAGFTEYGVLNADGTFSVIDLYPSAVQLEEESANVSI